MFGLFDSMEEFLAMMIPSLLAVVVALAFNLPSRLRNLFNN